MAMQTKRCKMHITRIFLYAPALARWNNIKTIHSSQSASWKHQFTLPGTRSWFTNTISFRLVAERDKVHTRSIYLSRAHTFLAAKSNPFRLHSRVCPQKSEANQKYSKYYYNTERKSIPFTVASALTFRIVVNWKVVFVSVASSLLWRFHRKTEKRDYHHRALWAGG